jgi:anthranilate synthase component 1/cyclase
MHWFMKAKKIIPCLDIKDGRVVKGVQFANLKDAGDPVLCAAEYDKQGADEIVFLDITATGENRGSKLAEIIKAAAAQIKTPIVVGGGVKSVEDIKLLIAAGASKVALNSAAVKNPNLIKEAASAVGSQKIVVAIDVKKVGDGYNVLTAGGLNDTGLNAVEWAKQVEALNAGEILLTSFDADGTKRGYDLEITKQIANAVAVPVTASGGGGKKEDFKEVFEKTNCAAALAASLFHFGEITVGELKNYLRGLGVPLFADMEELFLKNDLVPTIVQDVETSKVLMLAYMNKESLALTLKTGFTHFFSRSRKVIWKKGETSSHFQQVKEVFADCDLDTLLVKVKQTGVACHTGSETCFFNKLKSK